MSKISDFRPIEPLKSNRWVIKFKGMDIDPYLFRKYKMYNEGEDIIFTTEFMETVEHCYNPKDIFNVELVTIEYLDPTGVTVNGLSFSPRGINFKRKHSYSDDDFMITKLRFVVDTKTLIPIFKNSEDAK